MNDRLHMSADLITRAFTNRKKRAFQQPAFFMELI